MGKIAHTHFPAYSCSFYHPHNCQSFAHRFSTFTREETVACSEMVIFNDFGKSAHLPTGETVPVEFLPEKPGEYEFTCQMGMLRGKLIVE